MNKLTLFTAALALVLAGAGCNRAPVAPVTTPAPQPAAQAPADTTGVEAATEDLLNVAIDEDGLIKDESNDAQEMGDDKEQLNAIGESSYELRLEAKKSAAPVAKGFCARVATVPLAERASGMLTDRQQKLKTRRDEVAAFVASRRTIRDSALVESRAKLQGRYDGAIAKMTDKAKTPEQQAAVETFKKAAEAAATVRKETVDAAVKNFRDGLDKARADRQAAVDVPIKTFADAVKAAEEKAKADCEVVGVDPEKVRTDLKTSVEAARTAFQQSLKDAMKVGEEAPALGEARCAAFAQALTDYKAALEKAKAEFKAKVSHN